MNLKALTLAAILGVATPVIADIATNTPVLAQNSFPSGNYQDGTWAVSFNWSDGDSFNYSGRNKRTGDSIQLYGAQMSGNAQRRVYTWYNGQTRYQVAWRPSEPNVVRVQVFAPNGREVLNRLLRR